MDSKSIILLIIYSFTLLLHASNILILVKNRFFAHKPTYYILLNLIVSDVLLMGSVFVNQQYFAWKSLPWIYCTQVAYMVSIFSTLGINLDRFIYIEYCMRYHTIVSTKKLVLFLFLVWILPAFLSSSLFLPADVRRLANDVIRYTVIFTSCIALLGLPICIRRIRDKHVSSISMRNIMFGKNDLSSKTSTLKTIVSDIFPDLLKLNIVTVIALFSANLLQIVFDYGARTPSIKICMTTTRLLYIVSNPILYIVVMPDLKKVYLQRLKCLTKEDESEISLSPKHVKRLFTDSYI